MGSHKDKDITDSIGICGALQGGIGVIEVHGVVRGCIGLVYLMRILETIGNYNRKGRMEQM